MILPHDLKARASRRARELGVSLRELIRTSLEAAVAKSRAPNEDSFLSDAATYDERVPADLSQRHDEYLYGQAD